MGSLNKPGFGGEGFLDLPQQPNIEVGDFVDFHQGETVSDHPNKTGDSAKEQKATDPSQNPGMILVAKICNALVKVGYDVTNVRKVAKLVTDNMMTASPTQVRPVDDPSLVENSDSLKSELLDEPARAVGLLLQGLLDRKTSRSRSRTVQMNSNEPVVLINQSSRLDRNTFSRVVDETVSQLQHQWNIWPVRVYGGAFVEMETDDDGYCITLLNVVNTDIGGPSMVQLLDEPCDAPEWCSFTRREAWRERDLLYRDQGEPASAVSEGNVEEDVDVLNRPSASLDDASVGEEPATAHRHDATSASPQRQAGVDDVDSSVAPVEILDREISVSADNASEARESPQQESPDLHEVKTPDKNVHHPTWDRHDDSISLVELIKAQASTLSPSTKADSTSQGEPEPVSEGCLAKSDSLVEDEFVVV
ncbi:hypothetical protein HRR83_004762 [Exophiala dermatitidis]|uniref:DhaK domain-containing protein n=1 Tax=Exophiala dermatitidis TaxID=5970 RepID=A0AAN6F0T4_EXODE|nr:hypothetical protein HRR75_003627 [Exophiala dermatitidis]KAJ4519216.1 hypothetical protein HRR74_003957 [Exophiala dermatitidis]KAJ4529032.1 hypothetical protein HRR73_000052 [Exophiala dermatitidis]KAJ4538428.1 hypothetical protein HRR77_006913 [Exophiala dermatitidis]KAJ4544324.1 hypothetical protein HRR76_002389 [Exophiala dermatitidis]